MKEGIIILFLTLLVYNTVGFVINFHFVLAEWKYEMRFFLSHNVVEKDLLRFSFKKTEFEPSTHEFSKDGKLYDVARVQYSGEDVIVYCFQDDVETHLAAEFNDLLFQNTTPKGDFQKKISTIFKHLRMEYAFDTPFHIQSDTPSVRSYQSCFLSFKSTHFPIPYLDILTPPPRNV